MLSDLARVQIRLNEDFDQVTETVAMTGDVPPFGHLCSDAIVLDHGRQSVLLIKHWSAGWMFPGGHVDSGESPSFAASRELWEETGLQIDPSDLRPFASYRMRVPATPRERSHLHWSIAYLTVLPVRAADASIKPSEEGAIRWFPCVNLAPDTNHVVRRILDGPVLSDWMTG